MKLTSALLLHSHCPRHGPHWQLKQGLHHGPRWCGATHSQKDTPVHPGVSGSISLHNAQAAPLLFLFHLSATSLHFVVAPAASGPLGDILQQASVYGLSVPCAGGRAGMWVACWFSGLYLSSPPLMLCCVVLGRDLCDYGPPLHCGVGWDRRQVCRCLSLPVLHGMVERRSVSVLLLH